MDLLTGIVRPFDRFLLTTIMLPFFLLNPVSATQQSCPVVPAIPTVVAYGDWTRCSIVSAGTSHAYLFNGVAGDQVYVNATKTSGAANFAPCIWLGLVNPDGSTTAVANVCSDSRRQQVTPTLPATGEYKFWIYDKNSNDTGSYNMALDRGAPTPSYAASLQYGAEPIEEALEFVGDIRPYSFLGTQGENVVIDVSRIIDPLTEFVPCLWLSNDQGTGVSGACVTGKSNRINYGVSSTGTYTAWVYDDNSTDNAPYAIYAQGEQANGMVAHFPLDGDVIENTLFGIDGTTGGTVSVADRFGNVGSALSFDGVDDWGWIPYDSVREPSVFTVSLWFNTSMFKTTSSTIVGSDPDGYYCSHGYKIYTQNGKVHFSIDPTQYCGDGNVVSSQSTVADGYWHHVAAVYDESGSMRLYVDGVLQQEKHNVGYHKTGHGLTLGFTKVSFSNDQMMFRGSIDDLRIYNRALNQQEILDHVN